MVRTKAFPSLLVLILLVLTAIVPARAQTDAASHRSPRFLFVTSPKAVPVEYSAAPVLHRQITATMTGVTLKDALSEIAKQAGIRFVYSMVNTPVSRRVSLKAEDLTLAAALTQVLIDTGMDVVFSWNGEAALVPREKLQAQPGTVMGRVTEQGTGAPVPSAQVTVTGTGLSRYTDDKGQYRILNVPVGEREVVVRRVGYAAVSRKVQIGDGETVTADLAMTRVATILSEMVTTATGERSRLEVGNSIGTIKADSLVPTTLIRDVSDLLTARTPGVVVTVGGGAVGIPSKIRIRGVNSIYLNNDPIIILDGVRLTSITTRALSQTNVGSAVMALPVTIGASLFGEQVPLPGRLDDIDPNTIESIDVLRGPSAATLYGTEAANGVIVIKTKKAVGGAWHTNLLADNGWSHLPGKFPDYWFGWTSGPLLFAGGNTCGLVTYVGTSSVTNGGCRQDSVTHFNAVNDPAMSTLGTGTARNVSVNLSGGTTQLNEFLSLRYSDQLGISKLSDVEKRRVQQMWGEDLPSWMARPNTETDFDGSSRTSLHPLANLDLSLSAHGVYRDVINTGNALSGQVNGNVTLRGPYDSLGYLPAEFMRAKAGALAKRGYVSLAGNYAPLTWLTLRATLGGDYTLMTSDALLRISECTVQGRIACSSQHINNREETFVTTLDMGAEFNFRPLPWLGARTAVGEQASHTRFYGLSAGNNQSTNLAFGTDLLTPAPIAVSGTPQLYDITESRDEAATAGWYLEQTMAVHDRLFVTAALRQDAASAFGPSVNKSLPVYPKFSLSYLLSDEAFFPLKSVISSFRLRAAYGHSGNQARQTDVLPGYLQTTAVINGVAVPGIALTQIPSNDLRPERATEAEGGFDLSLFANERMHLEATLYRRLTKDAIMPIKTPDSYGTMGTTGGGSNLRKTINVGSVENRGVEIGLTTKLVDSRSFGWDVGINVTSNQNKAVSIDPRIPTLSSTYFQVPGYPIFGRWGVAIESYADLNGDGILSPQEVTYKVGDNPSVPGGRIFKGAPYPKSEVTWDNMWAFLQGTIRVNAKLDQMNGITTSVDPVITGMRCLYDPTCSLAQQAMAIEGLNPGNASNGLMRPANTLRFSELSLTYNVPRPLARQLRAQSAAVTVAGRNLAFWTNYPFSDPTIGKGTNAIVEANSDQGQTFPQPRNLTIRLNLGF